MSTTEPLEGLVASSHLHGDAVGDHRVAFERSPARLVHLKGFLCEDIAAQLSRFLLEQAEFYPEFGIAGVEGPVAESAWRACPEEQRFFRMGKLLRARPGHELAPEALRYLRFRRELQEPELRRYFERVTGLSLRAADDFGVHAMSDGDYLREHSDAIGGRRLALVLYLTPGWVPASGGALHVVGDDGAITVVVPEYNSLVAFDVRTGFRHAVTPVRLAAGEPPRVTIGGWYDGMEAAAG